MMNTMGKNALLKEWNVAYKFQSNLLLRIVAVSVLREANRIFH